MPDEEDFEITHDEYNPSMNIDNFIKRFGRRTPSHFQSEMCGSWVQEEKRKKIPVNTDSFREKDEIIRRLFAAWCHRPDLSLGQLVSMPFLSMTALFQSGDYDFIEAVETIRSLDYPRCKDQLERDLAILRGLSEATSKLKEAAEALDQAIILFGGNE